MNDDEKQQHYERAAALLAEQNLIAALIGGFVAMILAAVAGGILVTFWPIAYGFAAAGVGIVVGFSIGFLGRGIETKFAVVAALYALVGCVLVNIFAELVGKARARGMSPIDILANESLPAILERATSDLFSIALLYLFVAVVAAVFLSRRALSRSDRLAIGLHGLRD